MTKKKSSQPSSPPKTLRERAREMLATSRTDITGMSSEDVQEIVHELQVHQMELEIQNEDLRVAQIELAHSRDRYSDLYEFAPVGYLSLDRHGEILEANLTAASMLGVERAQLANRKITDLLPDEAKETWHLYRRKVFADDTKKACELPIHGAHGEPLTIRLESRAFPDEDGRLNECCTAMIDVTEIRIAEETLRTLNIGLGRSLVNSRAELQESIAHARLLTEAVAHLGEGVLITSNDLEWPGPEITFVNDSLCRITGYTAEELRGKSPRILQGKQTDRETLERIKSELSAGGSVLAELINYRKDGTPYDAELFITPLFNAERSRTNFVSIHRDVTERKLVEESLRREHELTDGIIKCAEHIILLLDTKGRIVRFNPYLERLTGHQLSDVKGQDWFDTFIPESDRKAIRELFHRALEIERPHGNVNPILAKDGREIEIEWRDARLTSAQGQLIGLLCTGLDITERLRVETLAREREERLQAILNTAADAIVNIDHRGFITDANPATERMFGYTQQELVGQNVKTLMPQPYSDEHDGYIARYLETGEARIIDIGREVVGKRKDGSTFPVDLAVSKVDHLGLFTGIVRDISEYKTLQRDILAIAEEEQRRIGQDLHDSTQQQLAGLGMLAQTLLGNLTREPEEIPKASVDKCRDIAMRILEGLTRAHQEVRSVSRGLVPNRLDPNGLMDALRELASQTDELEDLSCAFKCEQPVQVTDSFTATHLYRIAQESLANALKHAKPKHILIALESVDGLAALQIADDGIGFNSSQINGGMGLKTMQYRASLIGANLAITAVKAGGTLVTCKILKGANCDD